jgi:hypothetical protein
LNSGLSVAAIFRDRGPTWREVHQGHINLWQLKVMSAIERCRNPELGGHVWLCPKCAHTHVAYNSCRNRHCPTCQASASQRWLADRQAELLPVEYYHVVFTLPAAIADIAYQNKAVVYGLLCRIAGQTLQTIARDPKHLGARIGVTLVLHSWGSAMTHHPHVHCVVPGGGLALDSEDWVACKKGFFLPVRVLSRLFRRLFLSALEDAYHAGRLIFYGHLATRVDAMAFQEWLRPCRKQDWVVYAKRPFAGPEAVLAYLSGYTHRVAIANSRLVAYDGHTVSFGWKDYRAKEAKRHKNMTLPVDEFIRRFLLHVLPRGFHRIRYYGFLANTLRTDSLIKARAALAVDGDPCLSRQQTPEPVCAASRTYICPHCTTPMIIIGVITAPRGPPSSGGAPLLTIR